MEDVIKGYQWSPQNKKFMGEYVFPNNKDKEEIHMPPFTTLINPPISIPEKGYCPYWNGNEWYIDVDPSVVMNHLPIDDYELLMQDYVEHLKENDLWTEEDEIKRQEALDNIERRRVEKEEQEKNIDYLEILKGIRNELLMQSDWTQLPDVQLSEEQKESWRIYRQHLRDLPENVEDPKLLVLDLNHPDWPISPL